MSDRLLGELYPSKNLPNCIAQSHTPTRALFNPSHSPQADRSFLEDFDGSSQEKEARGGQ